MDDTSEGVELWVESQNREDTSLTLTTQVLSGIHVSGSLPLLGSTQANVTPSSISTNYSYCSYLSVPHMTGSLLQDYNPVWVLVSVLLVTHFQGA